MSTYDIQCHGNNRVKYDTHDSLATRSIFLTKSKINLFNYYLNSNEIKYNSLDGMDNYLSSLGVEPNDTIICIPDESINISLYFLNRKGFTDFGFNALKGNERIKEFIRLGADYLIITDTTLIKPDSLYEYTTHKIGNYKQANIYKLDGDYTRLQTLPDKQVIKREKQ